tara:strand:+ start:71 stop:1096 length:1026 start_codon:yes stop_codon:yes gene_type:complete
MAEVNSPFAKRMMAQKLMMDNKTNPFEQSEFFQPSDALEAPRVTGMLLPFSARRFGDEKDLRLAVPELVSDFFDATVGNTGKALRGELGVPSVNNPAFTGAVADMGMNVTGGSLLGSALTKSVPKNALSMGLYGGSNEKTILEQLKTLRSDLKNANTQAEKLKIEEQITALRGQREQQLSDLRKQANIERFGYDPTETGNVTNTSYRMQHQPRPDGARLDDMTGGGEYFPDDIYSANGLRIYGNPNNIFDRESFNVIQSVKGKPNAEVTIYRAVPKDKSIKTINPGDFVTLSKKYAELHAGSGYGQSGKEAGKILSQKVKVKEIRSDGNDLNEFGYFPESN